MKNLLLLIFLVPFSVSAQFSKGTFATGGNASYTSIAQNHNDNDYPSSRYLTVSPTVATFLSPSFSVGIFGQISSQNMPTINYVTNLFEEQKTTSQIYGLFARKYFPLSEKFLISLNGKAGVGSRKRNEDSDNKNSQFLISISPAITFLPHDKWGIEAGFGQITYEKNSQDYYYGDTDRFIASLGGLTFGINYFIIRN
ncbi:hypothetical protein [Algoriphagus sp.]|uniref:hypothetical protein n=1 Tax=Algoriphagus sp. TaxID=1872435 RepID=UPI003F727516